ncbi:hypothetical protein Cni_G18442 [Canna indica]|uniref:Uncharacterized protein n=1 Tax=Canna indica TaxID=4628 RepID=A0AAQ3QG30_9LILI|nr:hypothetical protein Cni_G18442 [Canna indica]
MTAPTPVDESLWWDSFVSLVGELDKVSPSEDLPDHLAEKLKRNHAWFLNSVACFKPPGQTSRLALDSPEIAVGSHRLVVKPELKKAALRLSEFLFLNEVQSYILVHRSSMISDLIAYVEDKELPQAILLHYFLERQCLLQCIRRVFVNAIHTSDGFLSTDAFKGIASKLVHDGFEQKLLSIFENLIFSVFSEKTEVDHQILWIDESLIEGNLLMDILFLAHYDSFCICNFEQWRTMCSIFKGVLCGSLNIGKLAVSMEGRNSFVNVKAKMLIILIETLDLEGLLHMVHDEIPFSKEGGSVFSVDDIKEMDALVSSFTDLGAAEAGPLLLAWAVFLSLVLSLPDTCNSIALMDIDHISYVRQAFDVATFDYLLEILQNDAFRDSDGPVSGFLSVMRTLLSAFVASYELSHQKEDDNILIKILDILYHIYYGQESLAMQFWDKDSFVDGPIRSILFMLEKEYPVHIAEFVRFLSALCEGSWPAECVYNYLDKMNGITTLFEIPGDHSVKSVSDIIQTPHPVEVPGVEGVIIPSKNYGQVLKVLAPNIALVHWECAHSGILLLVLHMAHEVHLDNMEDVMDTLKLLYRMISFNKALCFALMSMGNSSPIQQSRNNMQLDMGMRVDVVKIICTLIFKSVQDISHAQILPISLDVLAEMLKCVPSHVTEAMVESNIFGIHTDGASSGGWVLSGGLGRMLMEESGKNDDSYELAASVLDFTVQLVEKGEDNMVCALIVFCLQYVFVNHMQWRYKSKCYCWKLTLKVFEVIKSSIKASKVSQKIHCIIWDILLYDSSIHNILCRILCISAEALKSYISQGCEMKEIEYLQHAICSAFDVLCLVMMDLPQSQELFSNASAFVQMMFAPSLKPLPVVQAAVSLLSFSENLSIQVAAARALSFLCYVASRYQPYTVEKFSLVAEAVQIEKMQMAIFFILEKEMETNQDLATAIFDLLTAVAYYQPALLSSLILFEGKVVLSSDVANDSKNQLAAVPVVESGNLNKFNAVEIILKYVEGSEVLLDSAPHLLLSILNFLKVLWEGGILFTNILQKIRSSKKFWELLSSLVSPRHVKNDLPVQNLDNLKTERSPLRYRCQGNVLKIMAYELFFQEKGPQCEMPDKRTFTNIVNGTSGHTNLLYAEEILTTWFDSPFLENLIEYYADISYDKDVIFDAKVAVCVCIVHLITKLAAGHSGSFSIQLVKIIFEIHNKLKSHPAFSSLLSQYSLHGYSEEKELTTLIISDLYYHLEGKLEGHEITSGPFLELSNFLLSLGIFECNEEKHEKNVYLPLENVSMFDIRKVQEEIGAELWDHCDWKTSKEVAERMFKYMRLANLSVTIGNSKHFALEALVSVISVYKGSVNRTKSMVHGRLISKPAVELGIRYLCSCLQKVADLLVMEPNLPQCFLRVFTTQQDLLLILSMILFKHDSNNINNGQFLSLSILITKSSGSVVKVCADLKPLSPVLRRSVKLLLTLLLTSLEFTNYVAHVKDKSDSEVKLLADASLLSIGLLPVLCKYTEDTEYSYLSVAAMDIIIKALTPDTWLPILRRHLPLQFILQSIQEKDALASGPVIFNFLLTLGHTKGGAEMLSSCKFFSPIMVLLTQLHADRTFSNNVDKNDIGNFDYEKHTHAWFLSLAIIIAVIQSLGNDTRCGDLVISVLHYFFSEKSYMLPFYFSAVNCLANDHNKKRTQDNNVQISLPALKLSEHTLMLLCTLARYQALWIRSMKGMDSELREIIIHLLASISRGVQRNGDSLNKSSTLLCQPTNKEEVELSRRPSFIKTRHGWFGLSTASILNGATSSSNTTLSLVVKDKANSNANLDFQSNLSDTIAIHIYRIAFLLLKFLCMQAKSAAKRADEVEFVDLAYFPELPSPDILHGLQDQAIAIVTELCGANKEKSIDAEKQSLCCLLLQILEKSLYLELCVSQTCGIRPVLGRIEDFSKEIKALIYVVEQHGNFKQALRSLEQIIALLYPGLLRSNFV